MDITKALHIAHLVSTLNKVEGRKRLQKIVHLLSFRFPEFQHDFTLHYFGPFSRTLASEIDYLAEDHIIDERRSGETYVYSPTQTATGDCLRIDEIDPFDKAPAWRQMAASLDEKDTAFLEAASTIAYLQHAQRCPDDKLETRFSRIKPNLAHKFQDARDYVASNVATNNE
ncbi:MAG TPA: hypothetical protein P5081_19440 [Phycisphaerae bacterium]|nr:hypothetical protein [Phycisphaerae bacterium]HRW55050.1 hypothetical protein [Phycisphaerae bacterium]